MGAAFGLTTVTTPIYTGAFADLAGGIDVSFLGSYFLAGALYLLLETVPIFGSRPSRPPAVVQEPRT